MLSMTSASFLPTAGTGEYFFVRDGLTEPILVIAGFIGLFLIWYFRGARHRAMLATLTPLFDEQSGEMQVAGPISGGEDHVRGHFEGREVVFSVREPVQGHESPLFRIVLGSQATAPFVISVQRKILFGMVSQIQRGCVVKSGNRDLDKKYRITELMTLTAVGLSRWLFGSSRSSSDLQSGLQRRLASWLQRGETLLGLDILFQSCGVDYLATRIEYPGNIELGASRSGLTAVLRHYSKKQLEPENIKRILQVMDSLLRSTEGLVKLD